MSVEVSNEGDVVLITGASGALGRAVAAHLVERRAKVICIDRTTATLLPSGEVLTKIDLSSAARTVAAVAAIVERMGRVDAAVHTIGRFRNSGPIAQASVEEFRDLFETHVMTTVHLMQAVVPIMTAAHAGRIVVVSGLAALEGSAGLSAYAASKAAELSIVQSAAAELRGTGVTINAVLPGTMDTPQNRAAMPNADTTQWVTLSAVATVIGYLSSRESAPVTGEAIRVCRG
jgi:NAD(P)-dependent dehydrogenase (short-subunit alcohol dehydrogenase family)